jgi:cell wall-associated NlpC family hydrolase
MARRNITQGGVRRGAAEPVTGLFRPTVRGSAASGAAACLIFAALFSGCSPAIRYGRPRVPTTTQEGTPLYGSIGTKSRGAIETDRLKKILDSYLGTPYRWGGMTRTGVDCSGLVCLVYRELKGVALPRSAADLLNIGSAVGTADLKSGDLVFFRWGFFGRVDHVGIYTGEGRFVHASSHLGVIESGLNDAYYRSHLIAGRRLFQ